jgi:hypothetical protein
VTEPSFVVRLGDIGEAHDAAMGDLITRLVRWGNDGAARNADSALAATARDVAAADAAIAHLTHREPSAA